MNASDNDKLNIPEFLRRKKPDTATAAKTTIAAGPATTGGGPETDPPSIAEVDRHVDDVVERMKVHLANIDGAQATMISETKKAAHLLVEARKKYPDRERDICKRVNITFEGTRYYELLAIGAGRKSIAQIKDANAKRKRAERDRKKALPKPTPKLAPAPPAPIIRSPLGPKPVRDVTDQEPEPKSTAAPKMLSAQQAWSLIYPILEKVETRALGDISTQVFNYATRRQSKASRRQANRGDARV
jgi:hypothetical protein